jgi:SAM-dependent methyltransferase
MKQEDLPLPSLELADRVGPVTYDPSKLDSSSSLAHNVAAADWFIPGDPARTYVLVGKRVHDDIVNALPADFIFAGKRILDFGSGAGRVTRHFADIAGDAEIWGCDIDARAIAWASMNLHPFSFKQNGERPPLDFPDAHFDLIYAISVFTHITDQWSAWVLEMRRLLKPDGLLFATFLHQSAASLERPGYRFDPELTGMNTVRPWLEWERGGPNVYHSTWWLKAHWGRAFEFVHHQPDGLAMPTGFGHGFAVLRPKPGPLTIEDLERDEANEPRELAARRHNLWQLTFEREIVSEALSRAADQVHASMSWKVTAPLREASRIVRKLRSR